MKVLHIIDNLAAGGGQKLIDELVPLMHKYENIHVNVLILTDKGNVFNEKLKENGIKIDVIPFRSIRSLKNIAYIKKYIIKGKYDIVHSHLFPCNYWVSIASKLIFKNKPKFITTEHTTHNKRRDKFYFRSIESFIYSNYDVIISISESTQQNLMSWVKLKDKEKFVVIENGINLEDFIKAEPYKKSDLDCEFGENTRLLCMVGSFTKPKDQATIIRTMKYLPKHVTLLLVGDGSLKQEHEKLAKELEVDDRVKFLGIRKDVPRIFKTSDIVIVSSHWEGFGLVAVEGMAAGKPVIATDVPGLREVVEDKNNLFQVGDHVKLTQILKKLLNNEKYYKTCAKKSINRASIYKIEKTVDGYKKIYYS